MTVNNTEKFGENVKIWIGQIVDDQYWKDNEKREKWTDPDDIPGWGARYKVRIFGQHTENTNDLTNDNLPWVEVMYPVTAGSGHAGSSQTSNLRKGAFVIGTYKDQDNTEPLIIGCLGNNDQTKLNYKQTTKGFEVFSGFGGNTPEKVPPYSEPQSQGKPLESNTNSSPEQRNKADKDQKEDGRKKTPILSTRKCGGSELTGIQLTIQNLIQKIEKLKRDIDQFSSDVNEIQSQIDSAIQAAAESIAGAIKWVIDQIRKYVIEKINNTLKDTYYLLFPNERPELKKKQSQAVDLLSCLFNKIISNLLQMIGNFLLQIVDRYINAPLCAVEDFLGSLLGQLTGLITSAVDAIIQPILGLASLAGDILGFVAELLGFFSCEENQQCSEIKEWSIWDGAGDNGGTLNLDFTSILNKAESIASSAVSSVSSFGDFNLDFSDMLSSSLSSCNVGPILCGPPKIEFYGGGGSGTTGNVIVSAAGDILGVDIITPGSGYTSEPFTKIVDDCGTGGGAVAEPQMGIIPPTLNLTSTQNSDNTFTITWTTQKAESVETSFGPNTLSGTVTVNPPTTTTYTVTAYGKVVEGQQPYTTKSLTINPSTSVITTQTPVYVGIPLNRSARFSTSKIPKYKGNLGIGRRRRISIGTTGTGIGIGITRIGGDSGIGTVVSDCPTNPIIRPLSPSFKVNPEDVGVINIIIKDPGAGYLVTPNGSLGGDGRIWAQANETVIKRLDGTYDTPYTPGSVIELDPCDEVNPPDGPTYKPKEPVIITAPEAPEVPFRGRSATESTGKYPVVLYLCGIDIEDTGINYDSDVDRVIITPDNGAILEPVFGPQGKLLEIKIVNPGTTFTERPTITIETETGYNAVINPILCVSRLEEPLQPEVSDIVINVVDCVGKV